MNKKLIYAIVLYFCFYFVFVTTSFFTAPYVTAILSTFSDNAAVDVGYAFNISLFIAIVLMLIISYFQDKGILKRKITLILSIFVVLLSYVLLITTENDTILYLFIINSAVVYSLPAFIDSYILANIEEEKYFFVRSFGSFGAAVSYLLSAFFIGELSFTYIGVLNLTLLFIMIIILFVSENVIIKTSPNYFKGFKTLANSKNIILMFIVAFLTYGVIRADDPFTYTFNTEYANITPLVIGIVGLVSILFEGIVMNVYNFLLKYLSRFKLLLIAIVTLFFIFITKYLFPDISWIINFGNILFGVYVGFFVPIMIHVISKFGKKDVESTLLSIYQIAVLIGGLILGTLTTYILDLTNYLPDIYLLHSIVVILSIPFILMLRKID